MTDSLNDAHGHRELDAADPLHRVDPIDQDASNRDRQQQGKGTHPNARAQRKQIPREDSVSISEEARRAFEETACAVAPPTATPKR